MGALVFPGVAQGIATLEGYGTPGAPATTNNNPGNITCGAFANANGASGCSYTSSGQPVAVFPDINTGAGALNTLIGNYANQGDTLQQLVNSWVPPTAPGNSASATSNYANNLASSLGVSANTPVSSLAGVNPPGSSLSPTTGSIATPGTIANLLNGLSCVTNPFGSGCSASQLAGSSIAGLSFARVGAFLLGLLLIVGGIYLFKPVQGAVTNVVKTGAKAAGAL